MPERLALYSKRDCHLCEEAAPLLRRLAAEMGLSVAEVDIEGVPALWERYRDLIPVVALDGEALLYPPITEPRLRQALAGRLGAGGSSGAQV